MKIKQHGVEITHKDMAALQCVIEHTRRNMSWGEGGSFIDDDGQLDKKEKALAEKGIKLIDSIMTKADRVISIKL